MLEGFDKGLKTGMILIDLQYLNLIYPTDCFWII